jgi:type II secretory pathway pseudopilin PulG
MVVTVIAILALMILPLFRDRIEAARKAGAQDELQTLMKAETLAHADTGWFFRLQDLDNTQDYNDTPSNPDQEVPIAAWNHPFTLDERRKLRPGLPNAWKGPYISISRFKFLELQPAITGVPEFFWSFVGPRGPSGGGDGGPIMDIQPRAPWAQSFGGSPVNDLPIDKVLIDPWGTPYLFFGTGKLMEEGGVYAQWETAFGNAAIYSLGPDGMPGNAVPYQGNAWTLLRESGIIGTGDDYYVFF